MGPEGGIYSGGLSPTGPQRVEPEITVTKYLKAQHYPLLGMIQTPKNQSNLEFYVKFSKKKRKR
jgi:hypothetical protein